MITRYFISFNFAAIITFGLFFAMQMLINNDEIVIIDPGERIKIEFGKMPEPEILPQDIDIPERPVDVETPEFPTLIFEGSDDLGPTITLTDVGIDPGPTGSGNTGNFFTDEADFIVILRPTPQYPPAMAEKGIEGFVRVQYTITKLGNTDDVIVVNSSHRGFERSALKAAKKFKFKPRAEDGQPQQVPNVYSLIEFKPED